MLLLFSCQSFVSFVKVLSPLWKFFFDFVVMAGRPGALIRIVHQAHILNDHAILMEKWTVFTLVPIFSRTQLGQLEFLAARRCISEWFLPGSRIISDGWAAYAQIRNIDATVAYTSTMSSSTTTTLLIRTTERSTPTTWKTCAGQAPAEAQLRHLARVVADVPPRVRVETESSRGRQHVRLPAPQCSPAVPSLICPRFS